MDNKELLKLISLLLQYPEKEIYTMDWQQYIDAIEETEVAKYIIDFGRYYKDNDLSVLQENYVQAFDFNDKMNLYLTYSKLGDEKERGRILAELKEIYKFAGFELVSTELPDYLPLLLEFVSHTDKKIRTDLLQRFRDPIIQMQEILADKKNPYSNLLQGLIIIINSITLKKV
ncbi:MAG: nitrate reductase molybdenum cofactor assembly chaperone [Bacteroidales bacterium]|nr:nitrate reductase molybdenum cofactor assembly chaperone [Bacteroidales bacterium]